MKEATNITWLWLPTVVFAHLFAAFWLVKTLLLNDPQALSWLLCCWRRQAPRQQGRPQRARRGKGRGRGGP